MENIFEANVKINNVNYKFQIGKSTHKTGYNTPFSRIESEIRDLFDQGYEDNRNNKPRKSNFSSKFDTDSVVNSNYLRDIFKQAYNYGYERFDEDERKKYKVDLNISDPTLKTKVDFLIEKVYQNGLSDGRKGLEKKKDIDVEMDDDIFFINDIDKLLLKVYSDGYEKGQKSNYVFKNKIILPVINDSKLEERIKYEIDLAYKNGLYDYDSRDFRDYKFKIPFIEDERIREEISNIIKKAYHDGYYFKENDYLEKVKLASQRSSIKEKEIEELHRLIKKYGEIKEKKFISSLYQYIIAKDELKVKNDYNFTNIKSDNSFLLNKIEKIVNESYYQGKQDANNGLEKQFFIFKMPKEIKEDSVKNQVSILVNKAYNDGYEFIIDQISKDLSKKNNKTLEQLRLEELLRKHEKAIKKISNLPDRYVNKELYSVEIPNELRSNN